MERSYEWIRVSINLSNVSSQERLNLSMDADLESVLREFYRERFSVTRLQNLILVALYGATFLIATAANTLALVVFWKFQHMRRLSSSLLITLAISDLLVSLVCMPMAIGFLTYKLWMFGEVMCKLANYLQGVAVAASVFTMTVMSLDRYLVICHPLAFRRHLYKKHVAWSIICVWILAFLLFVPVLLVRKVRGVILTSAIDSSKDVSFVYCIEDWSSSTARITFAFTTFSLVFVVPGATMAVAYCRIGIQLCGGTKALNTCQRQSANSGDSFRVQSIMERRKQVAKRFLVLTTVFAVCWVPYNIATLLLDFPLGGETDSQLASFLPFGLLLGHVNSAINPLLYCWVNQRFRKCVTYTFRCTRHRDVIWDRKDIFQCQEYPPTTAASLQSSSLQWRKSLRKSSRRKNWKPKSGQPPCDNQPQRE